ncbi:amidohydrolase family protein [Pseudoroseomonas globiformis]|uniref:Amidohydrolase family protein n=1 Tax=Teichococcus globiformis TaxID=2307229 RepID=A0ABV7FWA5_9PROT
MIHPLAIPGPDPETRQPANALPPNACDAHCHVFGPGGRFPYVAESTFMTPDAPVEALSAMHRVLGIERVVLVQASCHGYDNSAMMDAIAADPSRRRGVAMVAMDVADQDLAALQAGGVRAIRLNFVRHLAQRPDLAEARQIIARVAERGWHVELHMDAHDIPDLEPWIRTLPGRFVIDHMGRVPATAGTNQPAFQAVLRLMERPNAWAKISGGDRLSSGPPFHDAVPFARALIAQAPDRLVWGTDWPHSNIKTAMPNDGDLADLLEAYAGQTAIHRILVENPTALYWR